MHSVRFGKVSGTWKRTLYLLVPLLRTYLLNWVSGYTSVILTLWRQKQENYCEVRSTLGCTVNSKPGRDI